MVQKIYMQRCLELAEMGKSKAAPNPMVGCVIVHNDKIIGEGYHEKYGEAHAEVNAINSVIAKDILKESTLYVNLEPCAHYGKTPPCALLIKEHKIPHIVIGCIDPFSKVAGKGVNILRDAGLKVTIGVLEEESLNLNKRFLTFHKKQRPYIILKWAESKDGFIDACDDIPQWLTNEESRAIVHKMRNEEAAIMVGTNTMKKDNPSLTNRAWAGKHPLRVTLDRKLGIDTKYKILNNDADSIIFNEKVDRKEGSNEWIQLDYEENILPQVMKKLYDRGVNSLIVEGGQQLLSSLIKDKLWDEAWQFIGPSTIEKGIRAPQISNNIRKDITLGEVKLNIYQA